MKWHTWMALSLVATQAHGALGDDSPDVAPFHFAYDIAPILAKKGCAAAKCHGGAAGRGGFKLSLFSTDPSADHRSITAELDARRQADVRFPLYQPEGNPACHLNIGKLTAGDWPSTVAGFAELDCRISFVPGETRAEIRKLIEETVAGAASRDDWLVEHPPVVKWWGWNAEPWYQDPADPLVEMGLEKVEAVTGEKMTPEGSPAGLDNRFSGYFGLPSFCLGPRGENIHGYDECVHLDSLVDITGIIALSTLDWCGRDKERTRNGLGNSKRP